jgi:site-specific recombinase XerD
MQSAQQLSLQSLVQGFIFSLEAERKTPGTIHYYETNLRRFLWYAKEHHWPDDPRAIDAWKLREFLAYAGGARNRWGAEGNGSENCREPSKTGGWRYYRTLRTFFRWAVAEKVLAENPLSNIKVVPPKDPLVQPYSQEEMKRLVAACDCDYANGDQFLATRNKAVILLFVDSGMRLAELANIKIDQLDLDKGRAVVLGKGGWSRTVAFSSGTKKALWKYLALRQQRAKCSAGDWLWLTEEGTRIKKEGIHISFRRIKQRARVSGPGAVHRLRHTFSVNYLREVKDPFMLQLLLGHKTLEMTRRYTQGLRIEEALQAIDVASPVERLGLG